MGLQQRDCSGFSPDSHLILAAGQRFGTKQCKDTINFKNPNFLKKITKGAHAPFVL